MFAIVDLAAGHFIAKHEDALFLGPPGTGKSHLPQGIGHAAIQQGHKVLYREAHMLLEELAEATMDGRRKEHFTELATVPLLIIDDLCMRKLPATAAEDLLSFSWRKDGVSARELWMAGSKAVAYPERYVRPHRVLVVRALNFIGVGLWLAGVLVMVAGTVRPLLN